MQPGSADTLNVPINDSLSVASDSVEVDTGPSSITKTLLFMKTVVKNIFFDYETISFNFSSDNTVSKGGIAGTGTGMWNFWGFEQKEANGPSRAFMLGLNSNIGARVANGNLTDVYSQKNNFDFKTSRPLWEGAKIDLSWKVGWGVNKSTRIQTDSLGNMILLPSTSTGSINRSFLSLPPVLFFKDLSGIAKVHELYTGMAPTSQSLSDAFREGFETLPLLGKLSFLQEFAKYIPRPNWQFRWDGLEKFPLFTSFAKRVSLDHGYSSSYTEGWRLNTGGPQEIKTQKVEYGFTPLVGLNVTFNELWGGNLSGSFKYNIRNVYDLGISSKKITENLAKDVGITAGYSKAGFELPLFGISLKNDIEFSFSYTSTQNSAVVYDMNNFIEEGTPQDGTIRTTLEPRVKYTISSRVTLSIFYRRSSVEPEGAARIPPTTTNEFGLDVHISIQP